MVKDHIRQDIKDYLSYDLETGLFTWIKPSGRCKAGSIAGTKNCAGYIQIGYKGKLYTAHRLAWWFVHGYTPKCNIDHINENPSDSRICNLRLDSNNENTHNNSDPQTNNTSGYRGVSWFKGRWRAHIRIKGKQKHLGYYDTPEEAYEVYLCAKRELHPFWMEKKEAA